MGDIFAGLTQVVCLIIGVQVIGRIRFGFKYSLLLFLFLSVTGVPLLIYEGLISVVYMMLVLFLSLYYKNKNLKLSIISVSMSFIVIIIADYFSSNTLMWLMNLTFEDVAKGDILINIVYFAYVCLILKIIDIVLVRISKEGKFEGKYVTIVLLISSVTVVIFYLYIIGGKNAGFPDSYIRGNALAFAVYTLIMIAVLAVVVKDAVRSAKVEAQALQMRQLQEYVGALEALQKDVRVFRHDYVNILSGINGFITNEDMDGLRVYFRTKVIPMNSDMEVNISKLATLHNLEVVELKGLFATKLIRAQELGVNAQVEVYKKIDQINMDSIDLCRAVGILLDNAIEAVMGTEDSTIRVAIIQKKDAILLVFANNLPEDSPPVHQFFDEGFSTKGENRGLGLSTLKKTLKKYPNVSLDTKVTQLGFVQELEIG